MGPVLALEMVSLHLRSGVVVVAVVVAKHKLEYIILHSLTTPDKTSLTLQFTFISPVVRMKSYIHIVIRV